MKLYFLNVGYGEAIVLTHGDFCAVIDGGTADNSVYNAESTVRIADFLTAIHISQIDLMICTHIHDDHIGGLVDAAKRFAVRECWCNLVTDIRTEPAVNKVMPLVEKDDLSMNLFISAMRAYDELRDALKKQGIAMKEVGGESSPVKLCDGVSIQLYGLNESERIAKRHELENILQLEDPQEILVKMRMHDSQCNTTSLAMAVTSDEGTAFLTGDLVPNWDKQCREGRIPQSYLLKLTHHGQKDGMPQCLVDACDPSIFVMCSDEGRKFDSACESVCKRCEQYLFDHNREKNIIITGDVGAEDPSFCAYCIEGGRIEKVRISRQGD